MAPAGTARSTPATARASPKAFPSPPASITRGACVAIAFLTSAPPEHLCHVVPTFGPAVIGRQRLTGPAGTRGGDLGAGPPSGCRGSAHRAAVGRSRLHRTGPHPVGEVGGDHVRHPLH